MDIPTIFTQPENFYSLACYTYILSGVICAVVRWFHMCRPFDQRSDYFYPARRQVTFFYAATALQLPYMLCPGDPGSWFFARSFGILYYPCASPCSITASSRCDTCGARSSLLPIFAHHFCCLAPSSSSSFFIRTTCFSHTRDYGNVLWYA